MVNITNKWNSFQSFPSSFFVRQYFVDQKIQVTEFHLFAGASLELNQQPLDAQDNTQSMEPPARATKQFLICNSPFLYFNSSLNIH